MERLLICSDIHRHRDNFREVIRGVNPDRIVIAGDLSESPEIYRKISGTIPVVMVRGNCDRYVAGDLPEVAEFNLEGRHFMVTHGHLFGGRSPMRTPSLLVKEAKKRKADIVIFGHTHRIYEQYHDGILFLNPGALRGDPLLTGGSYMILEIDADRDMVRVDTQRMKVHRNE